MRRRHDMRLGTPRSLQCEFLEKRHLLAVTLNEFLASNDSSGLVDQDGEPSDWIEIHNSGPDAVNLRGWHLTDDPTILDRWSFPDTIISADEYLVVFASAKNRATAGGELHANFKLRREGEFLALVQPDATIVSQFGTMDSDYVEQRSDVSYGIASLADSLETAQLFMTQPTPGAANTTGYIGFLERPTASVRHGFYSMSDLAVGGVLIDGVTLNPSVMDPSDTRVFYTTDGSLPGPQNATASWYVEPLQIDTTTILRVAAYADHHVPSSVGTYTYLFTADVVHQDGAGLPELTQIDYEVDPDVVNDPRFDDLQSDLKSIPTVSLVLPVEDIFGPLGVMENPTELGRDWERAASIEWIDPTGNVGFQEDAGLRIQGAGSRARPFSKKGFQVFFRSDYGAKKLEFPFFGDDRSASIDRIAFRGNFFDSWTFNNAGVIGGVCCGYNQALLLRDQFGHETHADMGALAIAGNWVHLYLNGQYWGLYNAVERPDEQFAEHYLGGDAEDYDVLKQRPRGQANGSPPEVIHGNRDAWNQLMELVRGDVETDDVYRQIQQVLDVDQFIDYVLLNIFGGNFDWPHNNWYAARERKSDSQWSFFSWDTENFIFDVKSDRTEFATDNSPGIIYDRLRSNAEFRLAFGDRVQRHMFHEGALTPAQNAARFARIVDEILAPMNAESARWGDTHTTTPRNTIDTWLPVVTEKFENYFPRRTNIVLQQLLADGLYPQQDAPEYFVNGHSVPGGDVTEDDEIQLIQRSAAYVDSVLVDEGAAVVAYIPQEGEFATTDWTGIGFDPFSDARWGGALIEGTTGIGYDTRDTYQPWISTDVSAIVGQSGSLLTRIEFEHKDAVEYERLQLMAQYDDAFVAYLNGTEIARTDNIRVQLPPQAARSRSHRAREEFEVIDVSQFEQALVDGTNVLAIQVINSSPSNVDLLLVPKLVASDLDLEFENDSLWFTVDGTDPRDPKTDLPSESAFRFGEKLRLDGDTTIRARALNGLDWSAVSEATYNVRKAGDLNQDGRLNDVDIDLLAQAIRAQNVDFDLTDDGVTDHDDLIHLVENLIGTSFGDANIDLVFDSQDLVRVFEAAEYSDDMKGNSTWAEGDWNGDGEFDSNDLVFAFVRGGWAVV